MEDSKVNIITYNLLSSNLSDPSFIIGSSPDNCNPENRLSKIFDIFDEFILNENTPIICLQELSQEWTGHFHVFFSERGYYLITSLYGNKFNGYMGVGIAFPLIKYKLLDCEIRRIGDSELVQKYSDPVNENMPSFIERFISYITSFIYKKDNIDTSHFELVRQRKNTIINLRLESRQIGTFCISTCHLPCNFKNMKFMVTNAAIVGHTVNNFTNGDRYILCGDFNSKPDSDVYTLLTTNDIKEESHPKPVMWSIKQNEKLISTYAYIHGEEPEFTYNSKNKFGEFNSTLDYIFCSDGWNIEDSKVIGFDSENKEWCPSATQPSDHYMVYSTLS